MSKKCKNCGTDMLIIRVGAATFYHCEKCLGKFESKEEALKVQAEMINNSIYSLCCENDGHLEFYCDEIKPMIEKRFLGMKKQN